MLSDTDETDFNLAQYNPFRYKGYLWIPSTGLYYLNARFYDPTTGRFVSEDPQGITPGDARSFNAYAYADNNPVMLADPSGTMPVPVEVDDYGPAVTTQPAPAKTSTSTGSGSGGAVNSGRGGGTKLSASPSTASKLSTSLKTASSDLTAASAAAGTAAIVLYGCRAGKRCRAWR